MQAESLLHGRARVRIAEQELDPQLGDQHVPNERFVAERAGELERGVRMLRRLAQPFECVVEGRRDPFVRSCLELRVRGCLLYDVQEEIGCFERTRLSAIWRLISREVPCVAIRKRPGSILRISLRSGLIPHSATVPDISVTALCAHFSV